VEAPRVAGQLQLDSLDSKVKKLETEVDELALERDALEKELDARKALVSKARSRPGTAILPHRGQNGTGGGRSSSSAPTARRPSSRRGSASA